MNKDLKHEYKIDGNINKDSTSSQGFEKRVYSLSNNEGYLYANQVNKYYDAISISKDVFNNIFKQIKNIENIILKEKLIKFTNVFISILSEVKGKSNWLPPFILTIEEDSLFLEWVFKDFRVGFTISVNEDESMWFMITNKNLEELSVSGDLKSSEYYSVIIRILGFVLENT